MGFTTQTITYKCGCTESMSYYDAGMGPASEITTIWKYCTNHGNTVIVVDLVIQEATKRKAAIMKDIRSHR